MRSFIWIILLLMCWINAIQGDEEFDESSETPTVDGPNKSLKLHPFKRFQVKSKIKKRPASPKPQHPHKQPAEYSNYPQANDHWNVHYAKPSKGNQRPEYQVHSNEYSQNYQEQNQYVKPPSKQKPNKQPLAQYYPQYESNLEGSIETYAEKPCPKKSAKNLLGPIAYLIPEFLIGGYYLVSGIVCALSGSCSVSTVTVSVTSSTTLSGTLTTVAFTTSTSSTSTSLSSTTVTISYTTTSTTSFSTLFTTQTATVVTTSSTNIGRKRRDVDLDTEFWKGMLSSDEKIQASEVAAFEEMFTASPAGRDPDGVLTEGHLELF